MRENVNIQIEAQSAVVGGKRRVRGLPIREVGWGKDAIQKVGNRIQDQSCL